MLVSIVLFLLLLTFLVVIHELGHLLTALLFRVKVEEFGIGFPPKARTLFTWKGVPFTLNWIPVGGFVRMDGENGEGTESKQHKDNADTRYPFYTRTRIQRLIVILAGASVNFLFGVFAFTLIYTKMGIPEVKPYLKVMTVYDGPAKTAGIKEGDLIVAAGKDSASAKNVSSIDAFVPWISSYPDTDMKLQIKATEDAPVKDVIIHTRSKADIQAKKGAISVQLDQPFTIKRYPWYVMPFHAAVFGLQESIRFSEMVLHALGGMVSGLVQHGKVPSEVAGPIGIVNEVQKQKLFSLGWLAVLNFAAILSINLAIMNVLPIPALDGGRAVLIILEMIIGKKRVSKIEPYINNVGFFFLIGLILLISAKDIWVIFMR